MFSKITHIISNYVLNFSIYNLMELLIVFNFIYASYLIATHNQRAFYFWLIANTIGIPFYIYKESYGMVLLSIYGIFTSFYGLWNWKVNKKSLFYTE